MIKITKELKAIPESLKPATEDFFLSPDVSPIPSTTTHQRRIKIINDGFYTDEPKYNSRYKYDDIKIALAAIYLGKCAYCEQKVELSHVEHYRPKDTYYWLAYSWDNLLLACPHCNQFKGTNFDLLGQQVNFINIDENIKSINISSGSYDFKEQPKMVNPELTDPMNNIIFLVDGGMRSNDIRFTYTIEKCKISRAYLRDERRKLLNDFKDDIAAELLRNNKEDRIAGIKAILEKFKRDAEKLENPFLAFRRYAIRYKWLQNSLSRLAQNPSVE